MENDNVAIESGQLLLHYRLIEKIGEGGMGVVWKAVDTKLDREAAIKVLPDLLAADAERLARFEREARLLASLNHPNVAAIYGIHEAPSTSSGQAGVHFLAMELVEGEDLAERLSRGALPRERALGVALEIARGFETAHERGVIHRDLKPANVKLNPEGTVKVLDFGLAKAFAPDASEPASPAMSPTLTSVGSVVGVILGTAAYMSPEQAKGKEVDKRADIWSFGVVLFEMLSGRRLFAGETISETLASVLKDEPDWSTLPTGTPDSVLRLLRRCLHRDPRSRLRDIGDARIVLEEALREGDSALGASVVGLDAVRSAPGTAASPAAAPRRALVPWLVAAAALVALLVVVLRPASAPDSAGVMHLKLPIPEEQRGSLPWFTAVAISPDGRRVVFNGRGPDDDRILYVRGIDQPTAVALPGTERAEAVIFSPDGEWIAFAQEGKFKKMLVSGGTPTTLCDARMLRGASWGDDGTIVFAPDRITGLMRIPDAGGTPEPLTTLDYDESAAIQPSHRWPDVLPGGRAVLFTATDNDSDYVKSRIVALTLDDLEQKTIVEGGTYPRYVPAGFLTFFRERTMFAARFDPDALELLGPAVPVIEDVENAEFYGNTQAAFSANGTLIYFEQTEDLEGERSLVWLDGDGLETPASARTGAFDGIELSPDGTRVALEVIENDRQNVWILELARDTLSPLTFEGTGANARQPVWSPDGEWIVFDSLRGASSRNLFRKRANGTGEIERLTVNAQHQTASSWSPDGRTIAFLESGGETGADLMLLHLGDTPEVEVLLRTPFDEGGPRFSPDGRWIAYGSNESGTFEVYVMPFGRPGGRTNISTDGGFAPRWSPDGRELFYADEDDKLWSVRLSFDGDVVRAGLPEVLFEVDDEYDLPFAVAPDGKRFLALRQIADEGASAPEPIVVTGWFGELDRKVPRGN